jgi:hypothetical protein
MPIEPILTDAEQDFIVEVTNRLPDNEAKAVIDQVVNALALVAEQVSIGVDPAAIVLKNAPSAHPLSRLIAAEILRVRGQGGTFAPQS